MLGKADKCFKCLKMFVHYFNFHCDMYLYKNYQYEYFSFKYYFFKKQKTYLSNNKVQQNY